ncbi:porin family protein [Tenacibaculum sp. 190524A02b]|uniref:porin family protein n=1 Tax=Tenacibaculum vairaonense TaxID=3137860 RepID=UPI0031FB076D
MKKLLIGLLFSVITIQAQDITFGVKAGMNLANFSSTNIESNLSSRVTFHVGGVVEIPLTDKLSIQPELLYSEQGVINKVEKINVTAKYNYLNVPIMAKYYIVDNFSLEVGPQIGFLLSAKAEFEENGRILEKIDAKKSLESTDFGVNFGLGYKLKNGLNFGARYNLGLTNISVDIEDAGIKHGVLQVSIGYNF